jgi:protoporphyrinogen oxidase
VRLFEAGPQIAGLAKSFRDEEGFAYDFGAHFVTNRLAAALGVGAQCRVVHRYGEAVLVDGRAYGYPFGLARAPRYALGAARARLLRARRPIESAGDWYRAAFGDRLADDVAIPLIEAWSGAAASELAPSVIPPQIDRGILHVMRLKLASRLTNRAVANGYSREKPESPHVWHVYPEGSLGLLCERLADEVEDAIELESPVESILYEDGRVRGVRVAGREVEAAAVVSTAPIHVLGKIVRGTTALAHLTRFRYRPMALVNMRFRGRGILPDVVTWTPERHVPFFRLTEAPLAMPWLAPPGKTMLTVDIGCQVGDVIWTMPDESLGERCLEHLESILPGLRDRYLGCRVLRTPIAHPVFLREYEAQRVALAKAPPLPGLYSVGRNGEFAHVLMEDVYWRTRDRMRTLRGDLAAAS